MHHSCALSCRCLTQSNSAFSLILVERSQKEIEELREELARTQKSQRDERRVRLLLEDKCKELRSANSRLHVKYTTACKKVAQMESRMEVMRNTTAPKAPEPPHRRSIREAEAASSAADTSRPPEQAAPGTESGAGGPIYDVAMRTPAADTEEADAPPSQSRPEADEGESTRTDSGRKKWGSARRKSARASLQV